MKNTRRLRNKIARTYLIISYILFGVSAAALMLILVLGAADPSHTDMIVWVKWFFPTLGVCAFTLWASISLQKFLHRKGYLRKKDMLFNE